METLLFLNRKLKEALRQPAWVVSGLMTPILYIVLFSPLLKNINSPPLSTAQVLNAFVPGILSLLAFSSGMGAGWTIIWEAQSGLIERFSAMPVSRFAMLLGSVLRDAVNFLAQAVLVVAVSAIFGFEIHLAGLAVLLLLLCLLTAMISAWSSALGLIMKQISGLAAVVTSLQLPLTLLSGVLLPISLGPKWLQAIAHINPLYYTVEASRVLGGGNIANAQTLAAFAVIVPLTAIALWWAARVYAKNA